ncbi:MAG TPA: hypothetical protein VGY30_10765 [Solirubrobacteraceae bacterium]|jgi:hypothetical protein|nr:hypothetical protein [Solirubrobacteraceae bacterium]
MADGTIRDVLNQIDGRMDRQDSMLADIKTQVTRTNGRVTALETANAISKALAVRADDDRRNLYASKAARDDRRITIRAAIIGSATSAMLLVAGHALHLL